MHRRRFPSCKTLPSQQQTFKCSAPLGKVACSTSANLLKRRHQQTLTWPAARPVRLGGFHLLASEGQQTAGRLIPSSLAPPAGMADPTNGAEAEEELVDYEEEEAEAVTDVRLHL